MNHPQPPGQQPYPPQQPGQTPAWGQPQHPGPYGPPPPKKGMSTAGIVGLSVAGVFGFLIVLGVLVGGDEATDDKAAATKSSAPAAPAPAKKSAAPAAEEPAEKAPVTVAAKATKFAPGVLHDGGAYTSVKVTITNNGEKKISINPLYFTVTDTGGTKHTAELGVDENQIDTVELAPGENISGVITGKGKFTAKYVTYTNGLFGEGIRGNVS